MKLQMATLCERAIVDADHLNVVGGATIGYTSPTFPAPLELSLACVIEFDALDGVGPHGVRVFLTGPEQAPLGSVQTVIGPGRTLAIGDTARMSVAVPLGSLSVPAPGNYALRLFVAKHELRRLGLRVTGAPCRVVTSGSSA